MKNTSSPNEMLSLELSAVELSKQWKDMINAKNVVSHYYSQSVEDGKIFTEGLLSIFDLILALFYVTERNNEGRLLTRLRSFEADTRQEMREKLRMYSESQHNVRGVLTCQFMKTR